MSDSEDEFIDNKKDQSIYELLEVEKLDGNDLDKVKEYIKQMNSEDIK